MTDKVKFTAVIRLMKYAIFIGFMGGLTQFALPPEKECLAPHVIWYCDRNGDAG